MARPKKREDPILQRLSVRESVRQVLENVDQHIKKAPFSRIEIINRMEIDDSTFSRFRRGQNSYTKLEHLIAFAEAIGIDYTNLISHHRMNPNAKSKDQGDVLDADAAGTAKVSSTFSFNVNLEEENASLKQEVHSLRMKNKRLEEENESLRDDNSRYFRS